MTHRPWVARAYQYRTRIRFAARVRSEKPDFNRQAIMGNDASVGPKASELLAKRGVCLTQFKWNHEYLDWVPELLFIRVPVYWKGNE